MENGVDGGWGSAPLDDVDTAPNSYRNRREVSFGSVASLYERRGSQNSARFSSRISCRSSVRDEVQTIDEFLRKQRVVRYMQEERERAARSKLEREEHDDWVNFRALERASRIKFLNETELQALLAREAAEAERERAAAEEAAQRGAEAALNRRRHLAQEIKSNVKPPETQETKSKAKAPESHQTKIKVKPPEAEYRARLQKAEEELQRERKKSEEEAAMRKTAETHAEELEGRVNDMQQRIAEVEAELRRAKSDEKRREAALAEVEELLKAAREQLREVQKEKNGLAEKCKQLEKENEELAKKLKDTSLQKGLEKSLSNNSYTATAAAVEAERELRNKVELEKATLKDQLQKSEAERKKLGNMEEEINFLRNQLQCQKEDLKRASDETNSVREKLHNETATRIKFENIASKSMPSRNDDNIREQLDYSEKEMERYKQETEEAKRELKLARENSDREIASLKAWCNRLSVQCDKQMKELKNYMSNEEIYTPRTGRKVEVKNIQDNVKSLNPEDSLTISKLQSQLEEMKKRLEESQAKEKKFILLQDQINSLQKSNKEMKDAEDATKIYQSKLKAEKERVREELEVERSKVVALQEERDILYKKINSIELLNSENNTEKEINAGNVDSSLGLNGISQEVLELREQVARLHEELKKEKQAREEAEKEAAALKNQINNNTEAQEKPPVATYIKKNGKTKTRCC